MDLHHFLKFLKEFFKTLRL